MENKVSDQYLNLRNPGSFTSLKGFLQHNPEYSNAKEVRKSLEDLETYTKFRQVKGDKLRRKVLVTFPNEIVSADLADLTKYSKNNNGYKWLLVLVDVFSRYTYVYKLKTKSANELGIVLDSFLKKHKYKRLWSDAERGIYSSVVKNILKSHSTVPYYTSSKLKALFSESAIKRIKMKLFRYFHFAKTNKWIDVVDEIVSSINSTKMESLGVSPSEVTDKNSSEVWFNIYKNYIEQKQDLPIYKVGDLVRISSSKGIFSKGYTANYTTEIFKIDKVNLTKPVTYALIDLNNEEISGSFYDFELTKVTSQFPKDNANK